jgi:hypothetical protein
VTIPQILSIGTANPPIRLTQEQSFYATGYQSERIRKIFLNSDIIQRHTENSGPIMVQQLFLNAPKPPRGQI